MNFHICIQARLTSSRLPYKILLPVNCSHSSPSIIHTLLLAVKDLKHTISLLTPSSERPVLGKILSSFESQNLIDHAYFGDDINVMNRYLKYFDGLRQDDVFIVRLCADSPCISTSYIKYAIDSASNHFSSTQSLLVTTRSGIGRKGFNIDIFSPLFWIHPSVHSIISSANDDTSLLKIIDSIQDRVSIIQGDIRQFIDSHLLDIGAIDTTTDYRKLLSSSFEL
ncbi:hypothetical protein N9A81_00725 [Synechococcus sp. AH-707-M23]|nr:hypothetical protein [Synechococcus sp. AH-707-M23]